MLVYTTTSDRETPAGKQSTSGCLHLLSEMVSSPTTTLLTSSRRQHLPPPLYSTSGFGFPGFPLSWFLPSEKASFLTPALLCYYTTTTTTTVLRAKAEVGLPAGRDLQTTYVKFTNSQKITHMMKPTTPTCKNNPTD